jgi:hypothetical protein
MILQGFKGTALIYYNSIRSIMEHVHAHEVFCFDTDGLLSWFEDDMWARIELDYRQNWVTNDVTLSCREEMYNTTGAFLPIFWMLPRAFSSMVVKPLIAAKMTNLLKAIT